jgi:hypothetical protein
VLLGSLFHRNNASNNKPGFIGSAFFCAFFVRLPAKNSVSLRVGRKMQKKHDFIYSKYGLIGVL